MAQPSAGKFLFCTLGIFICYSYFAILQEKVTRGEYINGDHKEKFTYMLTLVFVQCLLYCLFAKWLLVTVMRQGEDTTETFYYVICALTYMLAMLLSNEALKFVDYPTQVVGKAAKPIPVMVLGILLSGKRYPLQKYGIVALIVTGIFVFMFKVDSVKDITEEYFGQAILLQSLFLGGLTGAVEDRIRIEYQTKPGHMMYNINFWSAIYSGIFIMGNGEFISFAEFILRHPSTLQNIAMMSLCGAVGQYFIFLTISEFGSLACSLATSTRKCFTIVISVIYHGNTLLPRQWVATVILFVGLILDAFFGQADVVEENIAPLAVVRAARFGRYVCGEA